MDRLFPDRLALPLALMAGWLMAPGGGAAAELTAAERCALGAHQGLYEACREAVAQHPDDVEVRRNLGYSYLMAGRYDASIDTYREIAALTPEDPRAHFELANALGFIRHYGEAAAPLDAMLRLTPDDLAALNAASVVFMEVGRVADAVAATRRAAELGDSMAMYDLVDFYREGVSVEVDEAKALMWLTRAAESGHVGALDFIVQVYAEGLLGQAPDDKHVEHWAWKARQARGEE